MTKRIVLLIFCALALTGCRGGSQVAPSTRQALAEKKNPIRIVAQPNKSEYSVGDHIYVHLTLTISGGVTGLDLRDYFHDYEPLVKNPDGETASLTKAGASFYGSLTDGSPEFILVGPNFTDSYDFPLDQLFDFSRPGVYSVEFFRSGVTLLDKNDPQYPIQFSGALRSNVAKFRVVDRKKYEKRGT